MNHTHSSTGLSADKLAAYYELDASAPFVYTLATRAMLVAAWTWANAAHSNGDTGSTYSASVSLYCPSDQPLVIYVHTKLEP